VKRAEGTPGRHNTNLEPLKGAPCLPKGDEGALWVSQSCNQPHDISPSSNPPFIFPGLNDIEHNPLISLAIMWFFYGRNGFLWGKPRKAVHLAPDAILFTIPTGFLRHPSEGKAPLSGASGLFRAQPGVPSPRFTRVGHHRAKIRRPHSWAKTGFLDTHLLVEASFTTP